MASGRRDRWTVEPSETAEHIFHNIIISNILGCNCLLTEQKLMWMILYDWLLDLPLYIKVGKTKQTKAEISLKNRDGGYLRLQAIYQTRRTVVFHHMIFKLQEESSKYNVQ